MKQRLQGLLVGLMIGVLLSSGVVYASGGVDSIEVYWKQLKFQFDGVEKTPDKPAFLYNNTTYVPIRFIGEALGKLVTYDDVTETIYIGRRTYPAPPPMTIDVNKQYEAKFQTNKGDFTIALFAKDAPLTVNNFVFLANEGFYNHVIFHRIIKSFMIQTGDPSGNGTGGPGYKFADELDNGHTYEPGIVAMANSGPNTNGSQFFICTGDDCDSLNRIPNYTIFGEVTNGMNVVQQIANTPVTTSGYGERSKPTQEVYIQQITVVEKE